MRTYTINLMGRVFLFLLLCTGIQSNAMLLHALERLKQVYPEHIQSISEESVVWTDGTSMPVDDGKASKSVSEKLNEPSLKDQVEQAAYEPGKSTEAPKHDPGRIRYEPFFRKMYGNSPEDVEKSLVKVEWMPKIFGSGAYTLKVTTIHKINEKIKAISDELEELVLKNPSYQVFLEKPGGTYCWRVIANTNRLSAHSFGMTLDINASQTQYWQWDLKNEGHAISEEAELAYRNTVPWEIVQIFEKYGFIWGGKWYHYDTMHFEYRPELFITQDS